MPWPIHLAGLSTSENWRFPYRAYLSRARKASPVDPMQSSKVSLNPILLP